MKVYKNPNRSSWDMLCQRMALDQQELDSKIADIFSRVQQGGDRVLLDYTEHFDGVRPPSVIYSDEQIAVQAAKTPPQLQRAIKLAAKNIKSFHTKQKLSVKQQLVETMPGVSCWREPRPIERVGLYVPGGTAPLVSTVLMLGVPARIAGCRKIVLCTPPLADGSVSPAICFAAQLLNIEQIVVAGGAQAVAAMTVGTDAVAKVDKIFGPGNQYVTAAKSFAQNFGVAIDIPAGPSEVMVVADSKADPRFIAADLLSQAEHGVDSQVVLVATDSTVVERVRARLNLQLDNLSRKEIAECALENSFCVVFSSLENVFAFANLYAPEHLILNISQPQRSIAKVKSAGSVFLGPYTPESAGDYASGTNHTLPTAGWARSMGGVSLDSFEKKITFQKITKQGLLNLKPSISQLALAENLEAHARAVEIRYE